LTELAEHVGTTKSTAHNHLSTLRQRGYVVKLEDEYHLGYRFLEIGEETRYRTPLYEFARPELESLAEEVEGLVNLCSEENGRRCTSIESRETPTFGFLPRPVIEHIYTVWASGKRSSHSFRAIG